MKKETNKPIATDYCCPVCDKPLYRQWGESIHPGDKNFGVTLFCAYKDCPAAEVAGHGNGRSDESMIEKAYAVIRAKFCGGKLPTEGDLTEVPEEPAEEPKKGKRKTKQSPPVVEPEDDAI